MGSFVVMLVDIWFGVISKIVGFIIKPLFDTLVGLNILPVNFFDIANNFVNDAVDKFVFARDVIINVTGIPVEVFGILGFILLSFLSLYVTTLSIRFLLNAWSLFRTGKAVERSSK